MKCTAQTVETNRVQLDIEIEAQDFDSAIDKAYRKLVKSVNIPGFRKGKAPRHIFDRFVGKGALYEEAFEQLFPEMYAKAVAEVGIEPVDQPDIDVKQMEEGKPLTLVATVTVKPEVSLGDYRSISIARKQAEVTEAEVDMQIELLRERQAQLTPVEVPVEKGQFVTFDFEGSVDGEVFPGGTAQDYTLEIGSGRFIPGFEDQMIGMNKGETKDVNVTFPEDYPAENLKGKPAVFKVTVKEIKKKELPEVNDEFAKSAASKESLQELRDVIQKRLLEDKDQSIKRAHQNDVVSKAVEMSTVELPEVMVKREADNKFRRFLDRLAEMQMTIDDYVERMGQDVDTIRKEVGSGAELQVKTDLVIEAIAKKEGITASQEDLDKSVSEIAERYKQEPETIKSVLMKQDGLDSLKSAIVNDQTIYLLAKIAIENAEKNPPTEVAEAPAEAPAEESK